MIHLLAFVNRRTTFGYTTTHGSLGLYVHPHLFVGCRSSRQTTDVDTFFVVSLRSLDFCPIKILSIVDYDLSCRLVKVLLFKFVSFDWTFQRRDRDPGLTPVGGHLTTFYIGSNFVITTSPLFQVNFHPLFFLVLLSLSFDGIKSQT